MKRDIGWIGYKVHLTETCEPDSVNLIVNVATTTAPVTDMDMTSTIHASLAGRDLLPHVHLVDSGYVSARTLVAARRDHGIELLGPTQRDTTRPKAATGYGHDAFAIDWTQHQATCPTGTKSVAWNSTARSQAGTPIIRIRFATADCRACPDRPQCIPDSKRHYRNLTLRHQAEHEALSQARAHEQDPQWQARYRLRAGVEATISQAVRGFDLRRSRYRGLPKANLQQLLIAAGVNLARIDAWHTATPRGTTRTSHFAALKPT